MLGKETKMRYFFALLLGINLLYADSIIEFGEVEKKPYRPYENVQVSPQTSMPQTKDDTKQVEKRTDENGLDINTPSHKLSSTMPKQHTHSSPSNEIKQRIVTTTPVQAGKHLKGQEFFNYYIKNKPKGIVRDFYIWQYLSENELNATQINEVYQLLNAKNPYLRKVLAKHGKKEKLPHDIECSNMSIKIALKHDAKCLALASRSKLSVFKTLPQQQRHAVIAKLKNTHKDMVNAIEILASSQRTSKIFKANANVFVMVYYALSTEEKHKITTPTPTQDLKRLSQANVKGFYSILNNIVLDSKLMNLKNILLKSDITQAPHNTLFLLGINELRFGTKQKAMTYFKRAQDNTTIAFFRDRALFWQYLVSQDTKYLEELLKSKQVDIFSIYASQKLKKEPNYTIVNTLPSIALDNPPFDITDPYIWQNISSTMLNTSDPTQLAKVIPYFSYKDTMPQLAYLMQKIDKYATNYYITPYEGLIQWDSTEQQSFVFSIARQESHFIPTLISRSFALGVMQIMPANVKPFAKEMGRYDIDYNDLFDPKISLEMGRHFIRQLQKEYKNPLFVAYAYNGGPGFLRRLLAKNELFLKNRAYEPWLSMELIPYEESRFYGMRVIANFIIYEKLFGKVVNLEELLNQTLIYHNPKIQH